LLSLVASLHPAQALMLNLRASSNNATSKKNHTGRIIMLLPLNLCASSNNRKDHAHTKWFISQFKLISQ
jgi:hypothetical protein